jgi:hypothetical protein
MLGVTVLAIWLGAPFVVALALAGVVGGVGRYALYQWLRSEPLRARDAIVNGVVTAAIALAAGWLGEELVAPYLAGLVSPVARAVPQAAAPYVPKAAGYVAVEGAIHGPMWSGAQVADNAVQRQPLTKDVVKAFEVRAITFPSGDERAELPVEPIGTPRAAIGIAQVLGRVSTPADAKSSPPLQGTQELEPEPAATRRGLDEPLGD